MPKKSVKKEILEDLENEIEETLPEIEIEPEPIKKTKKPMSEKQLEVLALGRAKGREKLLQKHAVSKKEKEVVTRVKNLKKEARIDKIDNMEKIVDVSYIKSSIEKLNSRFEDIDGKFQNIDSKFTGYLTEREQRKADKKANIVENTIRKELPKTMNDIYMKQKIQKELSNNPFLGRV